MSKLLKLTLTLFALALPSAFAQTVYFGVTGGTPVFNYNSFKLGVQAGLNLTPEFEVRAAAEGNVANFRPEMASLDAFYNFFLNVDRLTSGGDAIVGSPTNNSLYLGAGVDGYYGKNATRIDRAYRFGFHGVVGAEAMLGRFGLFGELQPGVIVGRYNGDVKPSVRARLGVNFHL
jgi:hypothetical protein